MNEEEPLNARPLSSLTRHLFSLPAFVSQYLEIVTPENNASDPLSNVKVVSSLLNLPIRAPPQMALFWKNSSESKEAASTVFVLSPPVPKRYHVDLAEMHASSLSSIVSQKGC